MLYPTPLLATQLLAAERRALVAVFLMLFPAPTIAFRAAKRRAVAVVVTALLLAAERRALVTMLVTPFLVPTIAFLERVILPGLSADRPSGRAAERRA